MEREQAEFNSAISYLGRLNALFSAADEAAITLDAHTWFHVLLGIFRELSTEMKDEEIVKLKIQANKIHEELSIYIKERDRGIELLTPELHGMLQDYELALRRVMRESGLQQRIIDDVRKKL
jgi:hypothetical protein